MGVAVFVMIGTFDALWVVMLGDHKELNGLRMSESLVVLPMIFLAERGGRLAQGIGAFLLVWAVTGAIHMLMYRLLPSALVMLGSDSMALPIQ